MNCEMKDAAIEKNFEYRTDKSKAKFVVYTCKDASCKWRIRVVRKHDTEVFVITIHVNMHTCDLSKRTLKHSNASYRYIAGKMKPLYADGDKVRPKTLSNVLSGFHNMDIGYHKAWRAKRLAEDLVRGTMEENYEFLPLYLHMLKKENAGTKCSIKHVVNDEGEKVFKFLFIALGASLRGFKYCRQVLCIDAAFMKTKEKGILLVACGRDANNHCFPVAWGVADGETNEAWTWFLRRLEEVIPDSPDLSFVSDRGVAIISSVSRVYPKAGHGACQWHLMQNIKKKYGGKSLGDFKKLSEVYTIPEFERLHARFKLAYPKVAEYLLEVGFPKWARAWFPGNRYDLMTNNQAESFNAVMVEARDLPIQCMCEFIVQKLQKWFATHRDEALSLPRQDMLVPTKAEILKERWDLATKYEAKKMNNDEYTVRMGNEFVGVVNLTKQTCHCRVFDIDRIPCVHAIKACSVEYPKEDGQQVLDRCDVMYKAEYWLLTYLETIYPVPARCQWGEADIPENIKSLKLLPPEHETELGRPQTKRRPSLAEVSYKKRKYSCQTCKNVGHSSQNCPRKRNP